MTILTLALCLFAGAIVTLAIGFIIVKHESREREFWESVIFMRALISSSEISKTAYHNCLEAFREFDSIAFRDKKAFAKLWTEFHFKYRDFLPCDIEPKIKIIPDNTEGYCNYKIQV